MLEKEAAVIKLEKQLKEMRILSVQEEINVDDEIQLLEAKIAKMKEKIWKSLEPWDRVQIARGVNRLTAFDYINLIFEDFMEMHGDRLYGDDGAIVGGIAYLNNRPVTIIAEQKGRNTKENITRNFGMPNPEGYRKALRLMKQAEKFHRPVICFVDTPGAFCGLGAEERGQGEAIARNLMEMSALKVPILSIIIGEGGSGGALALAVANEVWMMENSIYSILSPEGFASILWKDSKKAEQASKVMKITAKDLLELGMIENVILEPNGGVENDKVGISDKLKSQMILFFDKMDKLTVEEITDLRYEKFRRCYS